MLADLAVVIHKADQSENQGKQVYIQVVEFSRQHPSPAQDQHGDAGAQDEHDAAHGGGAGLAGVPGGAILADLLSGLQLPQLSQHKPAQHQSQHKADQGRQQQYHLHRSLSLLCVFLFYFPAFR